MLPAATREAKYSAGAFHGGLISPHPGRARTSRPSSMRPVARPQANENYVLVTATATQPTTALLPLAIGSWRLAAVRAEIAAAPRAKIGIVQGNLHAKQGANVLLLSANLDTYAELSRAAQRDGAGLLLWPESVMNSWTPANLAGLSLRGTKHDPFPGGGGRLRAVGRRGTRLESPVAAAPSTACSAAPS